MLSAVPAAAHFSDSIPCGKSIFIDSENTDGLTQMSLIDRWPFCTHDGDVIAPKHGMSALGVTSESRDVYLVRWCTQTNTAQYCAVDTEPMEPEMIIKLFNKVRPQ